MTNLMRVLLSVILAAACGLARAQSCAPAEPRPDTGANFAAFATLERLEVRGGRPGNQDWEWGLGTNTQQTGSFAKAYLDWVSGRVLTYALAYDGAGAGTFTVYDGATQLATQSWNDPAKPLRAGNALKLYVKSSADSGTATVQASVATINGHPAVGSIQTAGNGQFSEQAMYWYFPAMAGGFTATGTIALTFSGANPPQGSRLNFIVTAGNITCQQASTPPGMYFVQVDHLNTPRLVANQSGQTVWRWDQQEPFGVNVADENPSGLGVFEFPIRFPGQYFDKETNLHYNYFRDYDPSLGRYAESDPIGLRGGLNTFAYADLDPLSTLDPFGLLCAFVDIGTPVCTPTKLLREKPGTKQHTEIETRIVFDPGFPGSTKKGGGSPLGFAMEWRTVLVKIGEMERLHKCTVNGAYRCWDDCTGVLYVEVFGRREYDDWKFDSNFVDRDPGQWRKGNIPDPNNLPPLRRR